MVILKNQHPTHTERYLFKTYGLYRSISNDQIEKYICIYAGTKTEFPSERCCFSTLSASGDSSQLFRSPLLDAIRARAAELGWK